REFLTPGRLPSTITTHAGFGYHWWPLDRAGEHVMADGMRGQFVYVDRPRRIVVVKTSAWPYDDPWWDRRGPGPCYLSLPPVSPGPPSRTRRPGPACPPLPAAMPVRAGAHWPFQVAGRRSANAAGPSAASSEASIAA